MSVRLQIADFLIRTTMKPVLRRLNDPVRMRRWFDHIVTMPLLSPRGMWRKAMVFEHEGRKLAGIIAGTRAHRDATPAVLYFFGGGFIFGSPNSYAKHAARLAGGIGATAYVPKYRLAPENPFPACHDDAIHAYMSLLDQDISADQIILAGDSAGGNIALVLLAHILKNDLPRPAGVMALCPVTDLTGASLAMTENTKSEAFLPIEKFPMFNEYYLGNTPADDPRVSPVFTEFPNCPPVLIHVSSTELLRDDGIRMAEKLRGSGADVTLTTFENAPHVWHLLAGWVPEANDAMAQAAAFGRRVTRR